MTDKAKPYTVEELELSAYAESPRVRATVEALEEARRERDEADALREVFKVERDEARAQVAAWQRQWTEHLAEHEPCETHHGARRACGQCLDSAMAREESMRREVERRDALLRADGYEDMRQHAQSLAEKLAQVERERDEWQEMHHVATRAKEQAEHAHNELLLSLPARFRDVAERQREACAGRFATAFAELWVAARIRATPLVTNEACGTCDFCRDGQGCRCVAEREVGS